MRHYDRSRIVVVTPRVERRVTVINHNYINLRYNGYDYYYNNGFYYRPSNGVYVVVAPPRGLRVTVIPTGFFTIMVGTVPYYYYQGAYYRRDVVANNYEVVEPPMGAIVPELPIDDVQTVVIGGKTYFEFDNILYKPVVTQTGVQYKIIGTLDAAM
jgi:hypothetical protein